MRPPTENEKKNFIISHRKMFINEVTKGNKSEWKELSFMEKIKVNARSEALFNALRW